MEILHGGAAVISDEDYTHTEGAQRSRVPISKAMGARDIAQTVSVYGEGLSPARRNPTAEEVLYVASGEGACLIDGHRYQLAPGTAVYVPPASTCQIDSLGELVIISVRCPEDDSETVAAVAAPHNTTSAAAKQMPSRCRCIRRMLDARQSAAARRPV